ncbi:MAG: polysaccharide biosynthesis tyrosine autokinase [Candidatus Stahlbacteria bacterium]|nr:polysaccharide biosynthesis tyrosine autokinase [Candidatus Stahlbacteria bacterium]
MEDELDIRKYLRVFLRRKWLFISILGGILIFTWIRTILTPKTFVASSKVLIKRTSTVTGESRILEEAFSIETNYEILKSKGFMERVANYMKENDIKVSFLDANNSTGLLLGMIEIIPLKNADILEIKVRCHGAKEAATIANSIALVFKKYSVEIARAKITEKRKFIENQLPGAEIELTESEQAIQRFKEKEGLVSISASGSALQGQLISLQSEYSSILSQISTKETLLVTFENELKHENDRLAEEIVKTDNSTLQDLRSQLLMLGNQYSAYVLAGLTKDHPKLIELDKRIQEVKSSLKEKATDRADKEILLTDPLFFVKELTVKILDNRADLLSLKAMKSALESRIEEYTSLIRSFPQKEYELARLDRDYRFNESVYQRLIEQYEETKITEVSEIGNVVVTEEATPPVVPISPIPGRNMALALVFGLGLGIGSVLLWEYLDISIKDVEEIKKLKIPVTGTISITGTIPEHTEDIAKNPLSVPAEAYKKLRMNLRFSVPHSPNGGIKSLLVTSCRPKEGKSTIVSNLGITFARADVKTVIVECDLRKPTLHKMFKISSKIGLTNLLVGDVRKEEIIRPTDIALLAELRNEFDMVVLDSPPLISCADGFLLANLVDGVMLVLELGGTSRDHLLQVMSLFGAAKTNFLGIVINKTRETLHYRYPYYEYTSETKVNK